LLAPLKAEIPPEVFTTVFQPPTSDGKGFDRENLLKASKLLDDAGWVLKDQKRINTKQVNR
jgi:microcin C transport system substrate-binding protein